MIPAATAHALRSPPFEPSAFTPTKFSTTEDKAWFGNTLLKFLANDSPQTGFTTRLYHRLSLTFGHIAHFNKYGFYETFFQDDFRKTRIPAPNHSMAVLPRSSPHIQRCRTSRRCSR